MKIWIIGKKCGLIKSIVKRLQKEGHVVHSNFSDDQAFKLIDINNVNYNLDSKTQTAVRAFFDFKPDIVIYTGHYGHEFKTNENESKHLSELAYMLNLSINSTVTKFIYLSSYEVYESIEGDVKCSEDMVLKPESLRGFRLLEGENQVKRWSDFTKKTAIILRSAPIYGEVSEESWNSFNNLNTLIDIKDNNLVTLPFSEGNPVHMNDLVDAIIKSFELVSGGTYNVAGDEQFTHEAFGNTLKDVYKKESESTFKVGEKLQLILDNKRIKNELEWAPKYDLKEGMHVSIENNKNDIKEAVKKREEERLKGTPQFRRNRVLSRLLIALEVPILFILVAIVYFFYNDTYLLQSVNIFIIYIAIVSSTHRISNSLLSAVFSSVFLIGMKFYQGYDLVNSLFDVSNIVMIIQYFLIWAIISYTIDRYREIVTIKTETISRMKKDNYEIEQINTMNTNIKNQLLLNITGYKDSLGKLYSVIDQLDTIEPEEIYEKTPNIVQQIMNCNDVSIYRISNNKYMRLHLATCEEGKSFGRTVALADYPELVEMFNAQDIYTNLKLKSHMPIMAAPIMSDGKAIAAIFLWNMPLNETTSYFKNKFKTLSLLIAKNLERANTYLSVTHSERYIEGTEILKNAFYVEILDTVKSLDEHDMADFMLLKVVDQGDIKDLSLKLTRLLRDTDYVGINNLGDVECILSNSNVEFSDAILNRFLDGGVKCEVIS